MQISMKGSKSFVTSGKQKGDGINTCLADFLGQQIHNFRQPWVILGSLKLSLSFAHSFA